MYLKCIFCFNFTKKFREIVNILLSHDFGPLCQGSWETFFFEITAFFSHLDSAWQKAGNFKKESLSTILRRSYIVFALGSNLIK